ncbi:MAG: ABC transporter ATP-binding protein, partial [Verrucomicrobiota bacterium]
MARADSNSRATPETTRFTLGTYWKEAKKYPFLLFLSALKLLSDLVINLGLPIVVATVVDNVLEDKYVTIDDAIPDIALYGAIFFGATLVNFISIQAEFRLATKVERDLSMTTLDHLLQRSYSFFNDNFGGSLIARTGRFVNTFAAMAGSIYFEAFNVIPIVIFTSLALLFYNVPIALTMLGITSFSVLVIIWMARKRAPYRRKSAKARSENTAQLSDTITNIHTVQAFAGEDRERRLLKKTADKQMDAIYEAITLAHQHGTVINILSGTLQAVMLYMITRAVLNDEITVGT